MITKRDFREKEGDREKERKREIQRMKILCCYADKALAFAISTKKEHIE